MISNAINLYGDNLNYHFFVNEIEEMAMRFNRVHVFLRDGLNDESAVGELRMLQNVVLIGLNRNTTWQFRRPLKFLKYACSLFEWSKILDIKYTKAAWVNITIGWRTAWQIQDSGLISDIHLSFWGQSPEYLVALRMLNPRIVIGTRLHSFDLYFSHANEFDLSTKLNTLNQLDFVAPISEHGGRHLKEHGVNVLIRTSYLGCRANEFLEQVSTQGIVAEEGAPLKIATIAKAIRLKRIDYTIEVVSRFNTESIWHQYGRLNNDAYADSIRLLALEKKSSQQQFYILGEVSNEELRRRLAMERYDFVLLLSESEGVPISLVEALAADTRIVVTDTYGCSELVQGDAGCLIPVDATVDECAEIILNWWTNLDSRRSNGVAIDLWEKKFNSTLLYDEFVAFLAEVVENNNKLSKEGAV